MAVNLHDKWAPKAVQAFTTGSILASRLGNQFSFNGVNKVKVTTVKTKAPNDYNRGNIQPGASAYGEITEVEDTVQEMTVIKDKGWAMKIDEGNKREQDEIKSAALVFAAQTKEQDIPYAEKYGFGRLLQMAGKVVGSSTAVSSSNICDRIDDGITYQRGKSVPEENKTIFMDAARYAMLAKAKKSLYSDKLVTRAFTKGKVDEYSNCDVVLVPGDRWPENVNFVIVSKRAAIMPYKLTEAKTFDGGALFSGTGLKCRYIFDLFVIGALCNGVYVDVDTGSGKMVRVANPAIAAATGIVTCETAGAVIKTTIDGTDPRYSSTAVVIASGAEVSKVSGTVIKAYAYKANCAPSDVVEGTVS